MNKLEQLKKELRALGDAERAAHQQVFFKTGKGQYGEGDVFLGVRTPKQRALAKKFKDIGLDAVQSLLNSKIHEERLTGLFILVGMYKKEKSKEIVDVYLKNSKKVNNWDLVDSSAHYILGDWLLDKDRSVLYDLVTSDNLWQKRIAIISTFAFIRAGEFVDTFKISEILLNDSHDLIHKAVGWMVREVGNRDRDKEEKFLKKHYRKMPRTMLRYAIEKFPENLRKDYLHGKI